MVREFIPGFLLLHSCSRIGGPLFERLRRHMMLKFSARRMACVWLCLSLCLPSVLVAQTQPWSPLLDVNTLARLLGVESSPASVDDLAHAVAPRVVHITGDVSAGLIPGAVFVPYSEFRGPTGNAGQLPALEKLQALVQKLGIDAQTPAVVVHQGNSASDFGAATRVYWTLKSLGVQQLAVLNGGFQQWLSAGLPVSQQPALVQPSGFTPDWQDTWRISAEQLAQSLEDDRFRLIDSRPADFYTGRQAVAVRPGTIPGADNLSFETWFDGALLKPLDQLQPLAASSSVFNASSDNHTLTDLTPGVASTTVAFCNTGHWASINWFVLSELLNVPDTRLYAESVVEWAQQARPMDNQPGRLNWYWGITRNWLRQITGF